MTIDEIYKDSEDEHVISGFYKNKGQISYVYYSRDGAGIIACSKGNIPLTEENAEQLGGSYTPEWLLEDIEEACKKIKGQKKTLDSRLKELSQKKRFIKKRMNK
jgi:hypothetical protein